MDEVTIQQNNQGREKYNVWHKGKVVGRVLRTKYQHRYYAYPLVNEWHCTSSFATPLEAAKALVDGEGVGE